MVKTHPTNNTQQTQEHYKNIRKYAINIIRTSNKIMISLLRGLDYPNSQLRKSHKILHTFSSQPAPSIYS